MKISVDWIKDFAAFRGTAERIAERLTMAGLEVKKMESCSVTQDIIFEVEITTNRPDWLSHYGVAREIAAVEGLALKPFPSEPVKRSSIAKDWTVEVQEKEGGPFYTGVYIEGIQKAPTPGFITKRLQACGVRPIGLIVDITNYVLLETGQPLHAFDADLLKGKKIVVRRARNKEPFIAINEDKMELTQEDLVIADAENTVALAGVMGGKLSEVHDRTKNILLESAYFHPAWIRRTSKRHGISSESSYRFERRVNPEGVEVASRRAVELIAKYAKPKAVSPVIKGGRVPKTKQAKIKLSVQDLGRQLGTRVPAKDVSRIAKSLGLKSRKASAGIYEVTAPSFRSDLTRSVDLVEEIARIYGFDRIPETVPSMKPIEQGRNELYLLEKKTRAFLAGQGLHEAVTFSLVSETGMDPEKDLKEAVSIINPQHRELNWMRPLFLPSLLNVVRHNVHLGARTVHLFEIANLYWRGPKKDLPKQEKSLGVVLHGQNREKNWKDPARPVVYYDLKGLLQSYLSTVGSYDLRFEETEKSFLISDHSVSIFHGKECLGYLGEVTPRMLKIWDLEQPVFYGEINLQKLIQSRPQQRAIEEIPKYPAVERDLAVVVPEATKSGEIIAEIQKLGRGLTRRIELFDLFRGGRVPKGHKNLAYRVTYQSLERTLVSDEIQELHASIAEAAVKKFQATFQ